jgi:hypothetical protein
MKNCIARLSPLLGGALLVCSLAGLALAGELPGVYKSDPNIHVHLPKNPGPSVSSNVALPEWTGSFSYGGTTYNYHMVGTAPSTGASTTIQAVIIPVAIKIGTTTFSPSHVLSNGRTVTENTVMSPLFDSSTTYTSGGVNVGTTQYEDAFQRANFWSQVSSHTGYHILLGGPTVMALQTLKPGRNGKVGTEFGVKVAKVGINWFDGKLQGLVSSLGLQPNTLPIFLTYDTYLTESGECCIGGYHNATGSQAYLNATYVDKTGVFSQDVSALSHEIGEWIDDPLIPSENPACGGDALEVGDPLEGETNYGAYPYAVNGFTYHLQDLVFLPYFGAPPSTSVNGQSTFQGTKIGVCSNGG